MKRITFLALAVAASSAFVGCSSDSKSEDPTPKTNSELLMAKSWSVTGQTETVGSTTTDVFAGNFDACELDDTFKFLAGNILTFDQGADKCDPNETRSVSGNWVLTENDTKLTFVVLFFGQEAKIEELTETKLVLSTTETSGNQTIINKTIFTGK